MKILDASNVDNFVDSIDTFLLDCDGVLWRTSEVIPGVVETLELLRSLGKKLIFVTNNSTKSREQFALKLRSFGIRATKDEVVRSAYVVAAYLRHIKFNKKVFVVGEQGIGEELKGVGMEYCGVEEHNGVHTLADTEKIEVHEDIGAVIVGLDTQFNYFKLAYALCALQDDHRLFLATNRDITLPAKGDRMLPGAGSIVAAISTASQRQPITVGKPEKFMMDLMLQEYKLNPMRTCMVGDRLDTDIQFGIDGGTQTLLVFTGATTEDHMHSESNKTHPTYYTSSISDIFQLYKKGIN